MLRNKGTYYILAYLWLYYPFYVVKMLPNKQFCSLAKDWHNWRCNGGRYLAFLRLKDRFLAGAAANSFFAAASVIDFGSTSFAIRAFFLPSVI